MGVCRVEEIAHGPMENVTRILVKYRIGATNYGFLWRTIEYGEWLEHSRDWTHNVILHKNGNKTVQSMMEAALFESWWENFVRKWSTEEMLYLKCEQKKEDS